MPAAPAGGSLGRSISRGRAVERGDGRQEEEEEEEYGGTLALKARRLVHGAAWRRLRPSRLFSIMAVVYRSHLRNHTQPNFTTLLRRPGLRVFSRFSRIRVQLYIMHHASCITGSLSVHAWILL